MYYSLCSGDIFLGLFSMAAPHLSNSTSRSSGVATCNKPSAVASVVCLICI